MVTGERGNKEGGLKVNECRTTVASTLHSYCICADKDLCQSSICLSLNIPCPSELSDVFLISCALILLALVTGAAMIDSRASTYVAYPTRSTYEYSLYSSCQDRTSSPRKERVKMRSMQEFLRRFPAKCRLLSPGFGSIVTTYPGTSLSEPMLAILYKF